MLCGENQCKNTYVLKVASYKISLRASFFTKGFLLGAAVVPRMQKALDTTTYSLIKSDDILLDL
jgi:hypothetical protein